MNDKFQDVLNNIKAKAGRSRLEAYGELVDSLQRQGLTCRDIAALLAETFQFRTSKSAVNNFIRARTRKRRSGAPQISPRGPIPPPNTTQAMPSASKMQPAEADVRQRIAALKARKQTHKRDADAFGFDAAEPLRIIDPKKQD